MKSFAQLKRDLQVGTLVKTVHNYIKPEKDGQIRGIAKVQSNAIAFETNDPNRPSWIWWKDHKVEYIDNTFKVYSKQTGELFFEYAIIQKEESNEEEITRIERPVYEAKNLTVEQMNKKALSFLKKNAEKVRVHLNKAQYIDNKQIIVSGHASLAVRLVNEDQITTIENATKNEIDNMTFQTVIDAHFNKQYDSSILLPASTVRGLAKEKEMTMDIKIDEDNIYTVNVSYLEAICNLLKINNDEFMLIAKRADDNKQVRPLKVLKDNPNWNGESVSDAILVPIRRA